MTIDFSKTSQKHIAKLSPSVKNQLKTRLKLFISRPDSPILRKHKLSGGYRGYWSINITGDYRLVYKQITPSHILVVAVGTHAKLYR